VEDYDQYDEVNDVEDYDDDVNFDPLFVVYAVIRLIES